MDKTGMYRSKSPLYCPQQDGNCMTGCREIVVDGLLPLQCVARVRHPGYGGGEFADARLAAFVASRVNVGSGIEPAARRSKPESDGRMSGHRDY
jgi:hypothetical protein